ncbi:MAG TPA: SDR family NAD(P)-dependent oxidoreductase, partial [Thermoanaerobaculia bacterium]|nr:SDR family NAD(P)-dependent oxidoreductase [Thermoanaerobaculia bacterium]
MTRPTDFAHLTGDEIAIVGMAGRFPGAAGVEELWEALVAGREGIVRLGDDELRAAGVSEAELADPRYVKAAPLLAGHDRFDAGFFGYSAVEAEVMDPQQRVLLECAWEALEDAGHDPDRYPHRVGVFAGSKTNTYLFHLASKPEVLRGRDVLQLILGGDQALLATRVSYKLNLRGPSYAVQTACSTALVAVHLACRSLLLDECRMALAGAVALNVPHDAGYRYDEGGILSPDGHCRPFDAAAAGTVFGSGAGMVVLKRLADAVADGDRVRAVLLGSATNNDGSGKATFTAPSVEGQTEVVLEALADAGVDARSIGYVEAHGTGTKLGDPIEVLALTNAYRASTAERGFCALGSVKGNLGHLDAAAGLPGLVKTVLALERGLVPKTLHFREPNPALDLAASPFHVAAENLPWPRRDGAPRRAAISSLGFGGTNAHLILEEAPAAEPGEPGRGDQLLVLSARSEAALDAAAERLARRLAADPELPLADVAWTLQVGRRAFEHRRAVVAAGRDEAVERLRSGDPAAVVSGRRRDGARVVFLFPGQGAQHPGMGRELYDTEEVFRRALDHAAEHLAPRLGLDLREVLFPAAGGEEEAAARLAGTALTQPAVFAVEHALARQWMAWGVEPAAMIGHSIGEYVAATLAGVFGVEDALDLVAERGRLMGELPGGAMAAVALPAGEVAALLGDGVEIAAVNAPRRTVVTGSDEAVAAFEARLAEALGGAEGEAEGEAPKSRRLHTSHAFHSAAMEPVLGRFEAAVARVRRSAPERPWLSNVTGTWITPEEAVDPGYWARHLRRPVRFADGVALALEDPGAVLLEVGPGTTLATFARESAACAEGTPVVPSLPHPRDRRSAAAFFHLSLGRLWTAGVEVDWTAYHAGARRLRVPLPTYPFERQRHWIDLVPGSAGGTAARAPGQAGQGAAPAVAAEVSAPPRQVSLDREPDPVRWLYRPAWRREPGAAPRDENGGLAARWLLLGDAATAAPLAERLARAGARVTLAVPGEGYERLEADRFRLAVDDAKGYDRLLATLAAEGRAPQRVVHLLSTGVGDAEAGDAAAAADPADALAAGRHWQRRAFTSLLLLSQALARRAAGGTELTVVSDRVQPVTGEEPVVAEKAVLLGVVKVLPKEHPEIACRSVDLDADALTTEAGLDALLAELAAPPTAVCVALRGGERWVEGWEHLATGGDAEAGAPPARWPQLEDGGVYLVTGGLGGVGSLLAEQIALGAPGARLVVTGRAAVPPREAWDALEPGSPAARRVAAARRLEALGAEVVVEAADAADPEAMAAVVRRARERFGRLDGAVHAAGIAGGGLMQLKTPEAAAAVLDPKVAGGRLLDRLLADGEAGAEPPFLLLVSSLQTVLGDFGQVDYTAANAFLDALAHERTARGGGATVSLDLDNFRDVGLLVEVGLPPHLEPWREELLGKALGSDEAVAAVARALASGRPRVAVSTQDLPARVELSRRLTRTEILRELGRSEAAGAEAPAGPALSAGELTRRVAAVWRRVLSLGDFDPAENFFDLGGDSLSGLQLVAELNRELGLRLAPVELYESPSVAALVARLAPAGPAPAEDAEPPPPPPPP